MARKNATFTMIFMPMTASPQKLWGYYHPRPRGLNGIAAAENPSAPTPLARWCFAGRRRLLRAYSNRGLQSDSEAGRLEGGPLFGIDAEDDIHEQAIIELAYRLGLALVAVE